MSANVAIFLLTYRFLGFFYLVWGRIEQIKRQLKRSFSQSDQGLVGGETWFLDQVDVCHVAAVVLNA